MENTIPMSGDRVPSSTLRAGTRKSIRPARILLVDHTPFAGGAQLALIGHIRYLDRRRFTPLVACTDRTPQLLKDYRSAGAEVYVIPMQRLKTASPVSLGRLLRSAQVLRRLVRREKVDLVVANSSRAAYVASVAVLGTGVPLIWWVRDFLFGRPLFRLLSPMAQRIIHVSRAIQAHYGQEESGKSVVVYVSSDFHERLTRVDEGRLAEARARWGLKPTDTVVGFMGRLVRDKGPQDLLSAVRLLHDEYPDLKLMLVGTGKGQEGDIEPEMRQLVDEQGLAHVIMTGYQTDESLYYNLFDIFVLSTREDEPFATSVVQAMMARKPVVATATGGTPEIVFDGETGLLVPPADARSLAKAIRTLLENRELAGRIASAGHEHALRNYRQDAITRRVEQLYLDVVEDASPGRGSAN